MKVGVILARFQPIHNGHIELIRQALDENEDVLVFIGSADKLNKRNPIPAEIRRNLVIEAIQKEFPDNLEKIHIRLLDDLTNESDNNHDWGFYLYSKVMQEIEYPYFTFYYSDGFEIVMSWFPPFITRNCVSFKLLSRGSIAEGISATKVREMILRDSMELINFVPSCVYAKREILKTFIEAYISSNPI